MAGRPLIVHHLERLREAGITEIVINVSYRAEQIIEALGDGGDHWVRIAWSREETPLETGGGIQRALGLLGRAPFLLVNGDVWCDLDPSTLPALDNGDLARLVLVDNPDHHPAGDFHLDATGRVSAEGEPRLTFAGISLLDPALVAGEPRGAFALAPLLRRATAEGRVAGHHHRGVLGGRGYAGETEDAGRVTSVESSSKLSPHEAAGMLIVVFTTVLLPEQPRRLCKRLTRTLET